MKKIKKIPNHIAIIMDGNGRWAKKRHLPVSFGHKKGVERINEIVQTSVDYDVEMLTLYAFSTENWKRSDEEINFLMGLIIKFHKKDFKKLHKKGAKIKFIGRRENIPTNILQLFDEMEKITENNININLNIAFNYGGRQELVDVFNNFKNKDTITENDISEKLYYSNMPNVDLLIRTSNEHRLSNFLLWQCAYAEFIFTGELWPDFGYKEFENCLIEYQRRDRRYGG